MVQKPAACHQLQSEQPLSGSDMAAAAVVVAAPPPPLLLLCLEREEVRVLVLRPGRAGPRGCGTWCDCAHSVARPSGQRLGSARLDSASFTRRAPPGRPTAGARGDPWPRHAHAHTHTRPNQRPPHRRLQGGCKILSCTVSRSLLPTS